MCLRAKHVRGFEIVGRFTHVLSKIFEIILNSCFAHCNMLRSSLAYFNEIDENLCPVIKLNLRKNKNLYVASVYLINKRKMDKYKELSYNTNR